MLTPRIYFSLYMRFSLLMLWRWHKKRSGNKKLKDRILVQHSFHLSFLSISVSPHLCKYGRLIYITSFTLNLCTFARLYVYNYKMVKVDKRDVNEESRVPSISTWWIQIAYICSNSKIKKIPLFMIIIRMSWTTLQELWFLRVSLM